MTRDPTNQDAKADDAKVDDAMATWLVEHADETLQEFSSELLSDPLKLGTILRRHFESDQARELTLLHSLRQKAQAKFEHASRMFFTTIGYEQSTAQAIASYKAERYRGHNTVDICCGIGGDATWLAQSSTELCIVDRSARSVAFANANIAIHGQLAVPIVDDMRRVNFGQFDAWHVDPDRRADGQRRSAPSACEPPLDELLRLQESIPNGAIKLAPAAEVDELLEQGAELEWIGCEHECRQLVAWFGDLAQHPGKRTATWISGKQNESGREFARLTEMQATRLERSVTTEPSFVYEPRPSVLAAGLNMSLAQKHALRLLSDESSLLASEERSESMLFRRFRVHESLNYHQSTLEQALVKQRLRVTEVKSRGIDIDPDQTLRQLTRATADGDEECVVIFFSKGRSIFSLICQRDDQDETAKRQLA